MAERDRESYTQRITWYARRERHEQKSNEKKRGGSARKTERELKNQRRETREHVYLRHVRLLERLLAILQV